MTRTVLTPLLLVLAAGCAEELGPEKMVTTRVSGVVREGRTPVTAGFLDFVPTDGTVGIMRSAPIGADGTFTVEGVAVGLNRVGFLGLKTRMSPGSRQVFDTLRSPIVRTVPPGVSCRIDFDLLDELAIAQAMPRRPE